MTKQYLSLLCLSAAIFSTPCAASSDARDPAQPPGATSLRLSVSPAGKVVVCEITQSSGDADYDKKACEAMQLHAVWNIPKENGKNVAFVYTGRLRFEIDPKAKRSVRFEHQNDQDRLIDQIIVMPLIDKIKDPLFLTTRLLILPTSKVARCTPVASSGDSAVDAETCATLLRNPIPPALDAHQQPVLSFWDMKIMIKRDTRVRQ